RKRVARPVVQPGVDQLARHIDLAGENRPEPVNCRMNDGGVICTRQPLGPGTSGPCSQHRGLLRLLGPECRKFLIPGVEEGGTAKPAVGNGFPEWLAK